MLCEKLYRNTRDDDHENKPSSLMYARWWMTGVHIRYNYKSKIIVITKFTLR